MGSVTTAAPTPVPTVNATEAVNGTEPVYIGESNATDTNTTEPVYIAESNMTDVNATDAPVAEGRVSALRGADNGY